RDESLEAVDGRTVEARAELFGWLIDSIHKTGAKDVVMSGFAAGSEEKIAIGDEREEDLIETVVDRPRQELRLTPALVGFRGGPDVKVVLVLSVDGTVRSKEHGLLIGRKHRIGVAIKAGERQDRGRRPLSGNEMRLIEDIEVVRRSALLKVEGLAIRGDGATEFVIGSGDDAFADHSGDGSVGVGSRGACSASHEDETQSEEGRG